ncbi:MAG: SRPBCC family protein [Chlamydiales bacterium]|nr:SRPBCC family protein [Chlamydiales bacterium]
MLIVKHTVETSATPEDIWGIWQDVTNWNKWDDGIEFSAIDGPFAKGTTGTLKPKGGPVVRTVLTRVEPMKMFVEESKVFLARMIVSHFLSESEGKTQVTHQIEMTGLFAFIYARFIGPTMKKNLTQGMEVMVKEAEALGKTKNS